MEDAYCCVQDLHIDDKIQVSYFAVFDGHGGEHCALFIRKNLHIMLAETLTQISKDQLYQLHDLKTEL